MKYKPGSKNQCADALSRRPYPKLTESEQESVSKDAYSTHLEMGSELLDVINAVSTTAEVTFEHEPLPLVTTALAATGNVLASLEDVVSQQQICDDLKPIIRYLTTGDLPADEKQARRLVYESLYYMMENRALYHLYECRTKDINCAKGVTKQLVVPRLLRAEILKRMHDNNAHPGLTRFYMSLRERYYWNGMYAEAESYVKSCEVCQKTKYQTNLKKAPLKPLQIDEVFGRYHIDLVGPMPETKEGYRYILVIRESATYWVELYPLKTQTSSEIAEALLDTFFRFGPPRSLLSDAAANLLSEIIMILCKIFKVRKITTSAYSQSTNALSETFNKTIYQYLRAHCKDQTEWNKHLGALAFAYRATPCAESLGYSPIFLLTGHEMLLPCDLDMTISENAQYKSVDAETYVKQLLPRLETARKVASENLKKHQMDYKQKYDNKGTREPEFPVGTKVLLFTPKTKLGMNPKMTSKNTGPYEVIEQNVSNYTCRLRNLETGAETGTIHTNRLRKYHDRNEAQSTNQRQQGKTQGTTAQPSDTGTSPPSVTTTPTGSTPTEWYDIRRILQCQKRQGTMYYRVQWKQKGARPEWLPASDVTDRAKSEFHRTRTWAGKLKKRQ